MFEAAEIGHEISKQSYKEVEPNLREALLEEQYTLVEQKKASVLMLLHGFDGAGRSETLQQLNEWMDPRMIQSVGFDAPSDEAKLRPSMWRYWKALPPKGKLGAFFGSYYSELLFDRVYGRIDKAEFEKKLHDILRFERMLANDGIFIVKFWFHLTESAQQKKLHDLESDPHTAWRVTAQDWEHAELYQKIYQHAAHMLRMTNTFYAPWVVIDGENDRYRRLEVAYTLKRVFQGINGFSGQRAQLNDTPDLITPCDDKVILDALTLDQVMDKGSYKTELAKLQARLNQLSLHPKFADYSLVLVFEGNDAAGKGGCIRRITQALDARRYRVIPVAAPSDEENAKPWLWRFWRYLPKKNHITIFDRSWYGRVLVERIEGFCSKVDWLRAYFEINDFEHELLENHTIVLKFWLAISEDEQLTRFNARKETTFKRYKITEEDWRNREKWHEYKVATSQMIERTSTTQVPWTLVEANNKYYARIKVLSTICRELEEKLG